MIIGGILLIVIGAFCGLIALVGFIDGIIDMGITFAILAFILIFIGNKLRKTARIPKESPPLKKELSQTNKDKVSFEPPKKPLEEKTSQSQHQPSEDNAESMQSLDFSNSSIEENDAEKKNESKFEVTQDAKQDYNKYESEEDHPRFLKMTTLVGVIEDKVVNIIDQYPHDFRLQERELIVLLLGQEWDWPAFHEWHNKFSELGYFPHMWGSVKNAPPTFPEETVKALNTFAKLSEEARRVLIGNYAITTSEPRTYPIEEIGRRVNMLESEAKEVILELKEEGLAQYPLDVSQKILLLRADELKELCKEYELPKSGKKAELAARLAESVSEEELISVLPAHAQRETAKMGFSLGLRARNAVEWEISKIKLLSHTISFTVKGMQNIKNIQNTGIKEVKILGVQEDPCPVCNQWNEKVIELKDENIDSFPPYHPGCRCMIIPEIR